MSQSWRLTTLASRWLSTRTGGITPDFFTPSEAGLGKWWLDEAEDMLLHAPVPAQPGWYALTTAIMDKGYDVRPIHDGCMDRGRLPGHVIEGIDAGLSSAASTSLRCCEHGRAGGSPEPTTERQRNEVALPDGGVPARVGVGQGRPTAPADPARFERCAGRASTVGRAVGRARVRTPEERMGADCPCACGESSGCGFTPTSRSLPSWPPGWRRSGPRFRSLPDPGT